MEGRNVVYLKRKNENRPDLNPFLRILSFFKPIIADDIPDEYVECTAEETGITRWPDYLTVFVFDAEKTLASVLDIKQDINYWEDQERIAREKVNEYKLYELEMRNAIHQKMDKDRLNVIISGDTAFVYHRNHLEITKYKKIN